MRMRLLPYGREALLVEVDDLTGALALYAALRDADLPGVTDLVPAARTVLIRLDPVRTSTAALRDRIAALRSDAPVSAEVGELTVPVVYDGADLAEVARLTGLTADEVVARHTGTLWTVAFIGFAPGFGYLTGDSGLSVPRRETPRTRIPVGAVALAGEYAGVYPGESPGGWQLIGTTSLRMWDPARPEPALLVPGRRIRFTAARSH